MDAALRSGRPGALAVRVWGALGLLEAIPLPGQVQVRLADHDKSPGRKSRGRNSRGRRSSGRKSPGRTLSGDAGPLLAQAPIPGGGAVPLAVPLVVPTLAMGTYELLVASSSRAGRHEDRAAVQLVAGLSVDVRLDRAQHRPGEPLRWSGVVRWRGGVHPAPGVTVQARVRGPSAPRRAGRSPLGQQRVLWESRLQADALGRVAGVFAPTRAPGHYKVELTVGEVVGRAWAFFHDGARRRREPPSTSTSTARSALAVRVLWDLQPWPDEGGHASPPAQPQPARAAAAPQRMLTVLTLDGEGHLAPAHVTVTLGPADGTSPAASPSPGSGSPGQQPTGQTTGRAIQQDSPGLVRVPLPTPASSQTAKVVYEVHARDAHGNVAAAKDWIPPAGQSGLERSWRRRGLALPRVVAAPGEDLEVPCDPAPGFQLVSLLDARASVAAAWCESGATHVTLRVPQGEWGLRTVRRVWVSRSPGRVAPAFAHAHPARAKRARRQTRETRGAYVFIAPPPPLAIDLAWSPRAGASTPLAARVTDAQGRPVAGAAVRVRVVEAVVAELSEAPRALGDHAATERPAGPRSRPRWAGLFRQTSYTPRDLQAVEAVLRSADPPRLVGAKLIVPAHQRWADEGERLSVLYDDLVRRATKRPGAVDALSPVAILRGPPPTTPHAGPSRAASARRQRAVRRARDPWGRPPTWAYVSLRHPRLTAQRLAGDVTSRRLDAMERRLRQRRLFWRRAFLGRHARPPEVVLARALRGAAWMTADGWGTRIVARIVGEGVADGELELRAAGPDRTLDTADDQVRVSVLEAPGRGWSTSCSPDYCSHAHSMPAYGRVGQLTGVSVLDPGGVPLPTAYDPTLVWAPDLVTGPDGRVSLPVLVPAVAPETTRWRVEVEAWTAEGATGRVVARRGGAPDAAR